MRSPLLERTRLVREVKKGLGGEAEEWARARIAKNDRFRTGLAQSREGEFIADVKQKYYDGVNVLRRVFCAFKLERM